MSYTMDDVLAEIQAVRKEQRNLTILTMAFMAKVAVPTLSAEQATSFANEAVKTVTGGME